MTDQTLTHLYFLLDRSGSMQSIKSDIEGGFAAFIDEQRAAPGECRVTLAQFDDQYEVVYADRDVADVPAARPAAAQHDRAARRDGPADHRRRRPARPRCAEDAAARHRHRRDHDRRPRERRHGVERRRPSRRSSSSRPRQCGWQFMYMGADQDAVEVGTSLGVAAGHSMTYGARQEPRGDGHEDARRSATMRAARMTDAAAPMPALHRQERADLA